MIIDNGVMLFALPPVVAIVCLLPYSLKMLKRGRNSHTSTSKFQYGLGSQLAERTDRVRVIGQRALERAMPEREDIAAACLSDRDLMEALLLIPADVAPSPFHEAVEDEIGRRSVLSDESANEQRTSRKRLFRFA